VSVIDVDGECVAGAEAIVDEVSEEIVAVAVGTVVRDGHTGIVETEASGQKLRLGDPVVDAHDTEYMLASSTGGDSSPPARHGPGAARCGLVTRDIERASTAHVIDRCPPHDRY